MPTPRVAEPVRNRGLLKGGAARFVEDQQWKTSPAGLFVPVDREPADMPGAAREADVPPATAGVVTAGRDWTVRLQALAAVLAVVFAVPALYISLDTMRDQQGINKQAAENLRLERARHERRYASRVAWWQGPTVYGSSSVADATFRVTVQNRSTAPISGVNLAFSALRPWSLSYRRIFPGSLRCPDFLEEEGLFEKLRYCDELAVVRSLDAGEQGLVWIGVGDLPPCTIATLQVTHAAIAADAVPLFLSFADPEAGWVRTNKGRIFRLTVVDPEYFPQAALPFARPEDFPESTTGIRAVGSVTPTRTANADDCTDQ